MSRRSVLIVGEAVLLAAAFLLVVPEAQAQDGRGYRSPYPWNAKGYRGYNEPPDAARPVDPTANPVAPTKYSLVITILPQQNADEGADVAATMAHVPENAQVYFGDHLTTSTGTLRNYVSPPLTPGKTYTYTVRVDWVEESKKVTQTHEFDVQPGKIHCIYLVRSDSTFGEDAEVKVNLAKLSPEDRKLAEDQKWCAVQGQNRLGSMAAPVKVTIKGQPVFLCCEACRTRAENNADQTIAKVKELKAKASEKNPK